MRSRTVEQISALFTAELPHLHADETHAYAHAVAGAGEPLTRWWRQHPEIELETVVERMMKVVWQGLQAEFDDQTNRAAARLGGRRPNSAAVES